MTDLLERLAQQPWAGIQRSVMTDSMARDAAEFDRDLALDALAELLSAPMTHQREKWPEVMQARTILAALKGETK